MDYANKKILLATMAAQIAAGIVADGHVNVLHDSSSSPSGSVDVAQDHVAKASLYIAEKILAKLDERKTL